MRLQEVVIQNHMSLGDFLGICGVVIVCFAALGVVAYMLIRLDK